MRLLPNISRSIRPQQLIAMILGSSRAGRAGGRRASPTKAAPARAARRKGGRRISGRKGTNERGANPRSDRPRGPYPARRTGTVLDSWAAIEVPPDQAPRRSHFNAVFDRHAAGLLMRDVVSPETCARACEVLEGRRAKRYAGAADNLGAGLGASHWDARYGAGNTTKAWERYFAAVDEWDRERRELLEPVFGCDPLEILVGILRATCAVPVTRAVHPRYGRRMGAGLIRKGAARPHLDNASFDLPFESTGHVGLVLVLRANEAAVQRAFKSTLAAPTEDGNYDLSVPAGTEYVDIPSGSGSFNALAAPLVHEVRDDPNRLTLALHASRTASGEIVYYS